MCSFSLDDLFRAGFVVGSVVNYGDGPVYIDDVVQAKSFIECFSDPEEIVDPDEFADALNRLDISCYANVDHVYSFFKDGVKCVACLPIDWMYV